VSGGDQPVYLRGKGCKCHGLEERPRIERNQGSRQAVVQAKDKRWVPERRTRLPRKGQGGDQKGKGEELGTFLELYRGKKKKRKPETKESRTATGFRKQVGTKSRSRGLIGKKIRGQGGKPKKKGESPHPSAQHLMKDQTKQSKKGAKAPEG